MKELTKLEFDLLAELADKRVNYSKDYPSELVDNAKKELIECGYISNDDITVSG